MQLYTQLLFIDFIFILKSLTFVKLKVGEYFDMRTIIGIFKDLKEADHIVTELKSLKLENENVLLLASEGEGKLNKLTGSVTKLRTSTLFGAVLGLTTGLLLGPMIQFSLIGSIVISVVVGIVIGAVVGFQMNDRQVRKYESRLKGGAVLVASKVGDNREKEVFSLFDRERALDVKVFES